MILRDALRDEENAHQRDTDDNDHIRLSLIDMHDTTCTEVREECSATSLRHELGRKRRYTEISRKQIMSTMIQEQEHIDMNWSTLKKNRKTMS